MKKVLIICGPTATGKTALAAKLAKKFNGELISADSRQVYKGMDIVTGKDLPAGRQVGRVKIQGLDLVNPDEEFSVAHFVAYASGLINQIRFPILVGGTGLYINSLVNPPATLSVKPNWQLRKSLDKKTTLQLQEQLKKINPARFMQMNHSDQLNPRRLIRAIEVGGRRGETLPAKYDTLWIGLTADKKTLDEKIAERVLARVKAGAVAEWQKLKSQYPVNLPSMSSIGYRELPDINAWIRAEQQYARRQMTYFKKINSIKWFNSGEDSAVAKLVNAWYTKY